LPDINESINDLLLSIMSELRFLATTQLRAKSTKYWRNPNTLAMNNLMVFVMKKGLCAINLASMLTGTSIYN
jgi:hypothetical protein